MFKAFEILAFICLIIFVTGLIGIISLSSALLFIFGLWILFSGLLIKNKYFIVLGLLLGFLGVIFW